MRLLLFSDLHCDVAAAKRLVTLAREVDLLVGAGDFGNLRRDVGRCLDVLASTGKPAILVPGNNESLSELEVAVGSWPEARVLHGNGKVCLDVPFWGLGGGVPVTPFGDWSFDLSEEEAERLLAGCPVGVVLVTHSPPYGAVDLSSRGQHLGSRAIQRAVERVHPRLVVCGHIHGSGGQQATLAGCPVVNAGPDGVLWDL